MKKIFYILLIIVFGIGAYFIFFNRPPKVIMVETKPLKELTTLNSEYLIAYGKVSKISSDSINLEVIKNALVTDLLFNSMSNIDASINKDTIIRKFDIQKQDYNDLQTSDIKIGDFVRIFFNNSTSLVPNAMGIEVFGNNIIE